MIIYLTSVPGTVAGCHEIGFFTFTFTFIRHHGKTHNHRPRGDITWRAQSADRHTQNTEGNRHKGGGSVKAAKGERR